ncbi:MAG: serine protease [Methanosarcina sp.]
MIKSGGSFFYRGKRCTIGAVLLLNGLLHIVTVAHIFQGEGDNLLVDGKKLTVTQLVKDFDLALVELPSDSVVEITELETPGGLEQAMLVNEIHSIRCRVVNSGVSLLFLGFQCSNMPEPGDSGSPILQEGKVIGIMSSVTLDTCMGIAISSKVLHSL